MYEITSSFHQTKFNIIFCKLLLFYISFSVLDNMQRARENHLAGRIRPAGRSLATTGLEHSIGFRTGVTNLFAITDHFVSYQE